VSWVAATASNSMPYEPTSMRRLPRADLAVSALGVGSTALGGMFEPITEAEAQATMHAAAEAGLRYFDTAPQYGHGLAEQRVGRALHALGRERFVLSTKVGKLLAPADIEFDYSRAGVLRSFEASLERLGLERIDMLFIHDVNRKYHGARVDERYREAMAGAIPALAELRRAGTVKAIGVALNDADICARFVREAELDAVMLPARYTLLDQSAAAELLPLCQARGVAVLVAAPFDSGILATGAGGGGRYQYGPPPREVVERVQGIESVCRRHGVALAAAALQFPLAHPAVTSVVAGMRSPREVEANLALMRADIPEAFWRDLQKDL
jgi:D-threo-aldose 1-dehydrogenase